MIFTATTEERRFLAPQVVQTSALDCGPAALKCLLEGFGIHASYGRLREACQTDVDGTSIDALEQVAGQLGLQAVQLMMPSDHLLLPETQALPAIVVTCLPNGMTHFVVVWRLHGRWVQIMDPASGRRWLSQRRFLAELYRHQQPVAAADWREWAACEGFCQPLAQRLGQLEIDETAIEALLNEAQADPGWQGPATLDAAVRMVAALVQAKGVMPGAEAQRIVDYFFHSARQSASANTIIPNHYWSVRPLPAHPDGTGQLLLSGTVLIQVIGRKETAAAPETETTAALAPELQAALAEKPSRPEWEIVRLLQQDSLLVPGMLLLALVLATVTVGIEALLFRGLLEIGQVLDPPYLFAALTALLVFLLGMLLLEYPISAIEQRLGRRLETRLRIAFMHKLPRLGDRYFRSRLVSDMAHRAYELRELRLLPYLAVVFLRTVFQLLLITAGIIWLHPMGAGIVLLAGLVALAVPLAAQPVLIERDLNLRTHSGGLSRFYLDALLGLTAIRSHSAEPAVRREHEALLVKWIQASLSFYRADTLAQGLTALLGTGLAIGIVFHYLNHGGEASGVLLLFYWTLRLPMLGEILAKTVQQYPMQRNRLLRLQEPLQAPEEATASNPADTTPEPRAANKQSGVAIALENVHVRAGGHTILDAVDLVIQPGEHIAIVGPSGAGKSSLVGLLLGWHSPANGDIQIDGIPLTGHHLPALRRDTAWVDPAVQIWNRSMVENLRYGSQAGDSESLSAAIQQADLFSVLERLPDGLQTVLGESGGLVSGGEGQRVRLGRAILRPGVRLAILDEPFRGLDRAQRQSLLAQARNHWVDTTLFFISHDVAETRSFTRVLVMENGQVVEDDAPERLLASASRYRALLDAEQAVQEQLWESAAWRRLWLEKGRLREQDSP